MKAEENDFGKYLVKEGMVHMKPILPGTSYHLEKEK